MRLERIHLKVHDVLTFELRRTRFSLIFWNVSQQFSSVSALLDPLASPSLFFDVLAGDVDGLLFTIRLILFSFSNSL